MTRFLLIRHALTDANGRSLAGRTVGIGLNARGREQAQALAARLAPVPIAAVYASPLQRTLETAEPIATLRGLQVRPCEDFLELEFGDWTGCELHELSGDPQFHRFNQMRSCAPAPRGEYMLQAQARMAMGLDRLREVHPQQTVAVISHGDLIRAALAHYAGIPLDLFQRLEVSPASISVVDIDETWLRIVGINDTAGEALLA